jgi:hypothetical protein
MSRLAKSYLLVGGYELTRLSSRCDTLLLRRCFSSTYLLRPHCRHLRLDDFGIYDGDEHEYLGIGSQVILFCH